MDSDKSTDRLRRAGVLVLSLGVLLGLWFASDGPRLIVRLVEGDGFPGAYRYLSIHRSLDPDVRTTAYYVEHGLPVLYRLAFAFMAIGAAFAAAATWLDRTMRAFLKETSSARDLALLRITVFGAMCWWWLSNDVTAFAALPPELIVPPPGLNWAVPYLPTDPSISGALSIAFAVAAAMAAVGLWTRWSAWSATILGVVVLGLPQFYGKIDHYHHFIWFGALLAAAPSGDAWSVDSWRRRRNVAHDASRAYGFPIRVIMLLIGCFYFFAGFWKMVIGGPEWARETLRTILHAQWMRIDQVPTFRVDTWGVWTNFGGWSVMAFELLFVLLILNQRTRIWAAAAGVAFHLAVWLTTGINFWTLLVCYTVFVKTSWFRKSASRSPEAGPEPGPSIVLRRLGAALIFAVVAAGISLVDSWPLAVYPTFAGVAEPRAWTVTIEGTAPDGRCVQVRPWRSRALRSRYGNSRVAGLVSQVAWTQDAERRAAKAVALAAVAVELEPSLRGMTELLVLRELVAVEPDAWKQPPIRRELLGIWRPSRG